MFTKKLLMEEASDKSFQEPALCGSLKNCINISTGSVSRKSWKN